MMGIWELLSHPEEFLAILRFKLCPDLVFKSNKDQKHSSPTLQRCYELFSMTGRSVALVSRLLDKPIRDFVCLCYLLLRSIDAIEEDSTIPSKKRVVMLKSFYKYIDDPHWSYPCSKDRHGVVLKEFPAISCEVRKLSTDQRKKLTEMCKKVGEIDARHIETEIVYQMEDFREYFHAFSVFPAENILKVAVEYGGANENVLQDFWMLKHVADFWTGTNQARDLYEDLTTVGKIYWPKEMWGKYVDNMADLTHPKNKEMALAFLNEIVTFCLMGIPKTILLLSHLHETKTLHFLAAIYVQAMATLERIYNNYQVFSGAVKIRKGETVRLILEAKSLDKTKAMFHHYLERIMLRIPEEDPNAAETRLACQQAMEACRTTVKFETRTKLVTFCSLGLVLLVSLMAAYIVSYFYV